MNEITNAKGTQVYFPSNLNNIRASDKITPAQNKWDDGKHNSFLFPKLLLVRPANKNVTFKVSKDCKIHVRFSVLSHVVFSDADTYYKRGIL